MGSVSVGRKVMEVGVGNDGFRGGRWFHKSQVVGLVFWISSKIAKYQSKGRWIWWIWDKIL